MCLITRYAYDAAGNVTRITHPDGNTQEFSAFTTFNQPQRIKDPRGNWTLLKYDAPGNLTDDIKLKTGVIPVVGIAPAASQIVAWTTRTYDTTGNLITSKRVRNFTTGAGPTVSTTYDLNGLNPAQLTRTGDQTGDGLDDAPDTAVLAYDPLGKLARLQIRRRRQRHPPHRRRRPDRRHPIRRHEPPGVRPGPGRQQRCHRLRPQRCRSSTQASVAWMQ
jgi:uncharacterized protein RhaS with RHS repeats